MPELKPCPSCGSTSIDPCGWKSADASGPVCDGCGLSAESVERWNTRTESLAVAAAERAFALLPKPPIGIPDTIESRAAWAVQEIENHQNLADAAMTAKKRIVVNVSLGECHVTITSNKKTEAAIADLVLSGIEIMKMTEKTGVEIQHAEEIAKKDAEIARLKADLARVREQRDKSLIDLAAKNHDILFADLPMARCVTLADHGFRVLDNNGVRTVEEIEK